MPYKAQDITKNVNKRTEGRAGTKMDLGMEFFFALDELCLDRHWWWRNKRFVLQAVVGTAAYDISQVAADFAQFDELFLLDPTGLLIQSQLNPIFESTAQLAAILNATPDTPTAYFIDATVGPQALQLQAPSNVNQKLMGKYWAMPMVTDSSQDTIPLLPAFLHWGLIHALERRVFKFLYGVGDVRASTAEADYQRFMLIADRQPNWSDKKVSNISTGSKAVQSH
jgi:hypothetical protein